DLDSRRSARRQGGRRDGAARFDDRHRAGGAHPRGWVARDERQRHLEQPDLRDRRRSHELSEHQSVHRRRTGQRAQRHRPERDRRHRDREGPVGGDVVRHGRGERRDRDHDQEGPRRRHALDLDGEGGTVNDNNTYPTDYASWGHDPKTSAVKRCTLVTESQGSCILDSLTSFSVLMNPATTSIRTGNTNTFGGNASGGTDQVRFFASGDVRNELGPIQMPGFAKATLDSMDTALRDDWTHPEAFQSENFRTNLSAA